MLSGSNRSDHQKYIYGVCQRSSTVDTWVERMNPKTKRRGTSNLGLLCLCLVCVSTRK